MKNTTLLLALLILAGSVVFAQTKTPQINKTRKHQVERIKQGVKSGELTKQETKVLASGQKHIQKEKAAAKADGIVTPVEKKHIVKDQIKASKDIARLKHNKKEQKQ